MTNPIVGSPLKNKYAGLDHLRALAIILVFFYHYGNLFPHPGWVHNISQFGWTGVDLFFVLSGFLIASQLFEKIGRDKKISLKEFFIKRFFRIIPAYSLVVAVYFLVPASRERSGLAPLWKYLTFTQNLGLDVRTQGAFSHAWSLCIEEQFYLFLPLILILLIYLNALKKGLIILFTLFLLGFLARYIAWHFYVAPQVDADDFGIYWSKWIYYPTYSRADGLLMGVSIAAIFQFKPRIKERLQKHGNLLILASLLVFTAGYLLFTGDQSVANSVFGFPLVDFGYAIMVTGAICPSCFLYKTQSRTLFQVAAFSYIIYLVHKIVIHVTQEQFTKLDIDKESNLMFVICIATTVLIAFILNRLIEKPSLRLRNKILRIKQK